MKIKYIQVFLVLLAVAISTHLTAQDLENLGAIVKQKPVVVSGSLGLGSSVYYSNNLNQGNSPFGYALNGNVNISLYGLYNIPITVFVSNLARGASSQLPPLVNLGFQPTYKRFTFYGGWNTVNFSQYTLAGAPFVGGGMEYKGKWFKIGAVGGRFQKAYGDTVELAQQLGYKRMGWGAKLGFGNDRNFIDFTAFRAQDDTNSLSIRLTTPESSAKDNVAGGTAWRVGFFKSRLTFEGELALSALSRDMRAQTIDLETTLPPQYAQYANVEKLFKLRYTTAIYHAASTSLGWQGSKGQLKLQYRRVSKDYQSLGAIYNQNNFENYTVSGGFSAWKSRIRVNFNGGIQHDELPLVGSNVTIKDRLLLFATAGGYAKKLNSTLPVFTYRRIGSGSLSFNPNQNYGLDLNFSNFLTDQQMSKRLLLDTARTAQATTSFMVMNRFTIIKPANIHNIVVVYNYSIFDNNVTNNPTLPLSIGNNTVGTVSYSLSFPKRKFSTNANVNYTQSKFGADPITYIGAMAGGNISVLKNKMSLGANVGYGVNKIKNEQSGNINFSFNSSYQPFERQSFNANIVMLRNKAAQALAPALGEFRGDIGYTYTF